METRETMNMAKTRAILARAHLAMRRMSSKLAHRRSTSESDSVDTRYGELRHDGSPRTLHIQEGAV